MEGNKIKFKEIISTKLASTPLTAGQFLFTKDTCNLYLDTDSERITIGGKNIINNLSTQPDWNQTDTTKIDYIKNKPDISSGNVPDATSSNKGIAKLYTTTGQNTDGSITQKAITDNFAKFQVVESGDFNNMKTPGLYTMKSSSTNAPTSGSYHSLLVMKSDSGNYVQQVAIKESTTDMYLRHLNGSSWSAWKRVMMAGDNASSATKLATARNIAGHAFDGTADINISASDVNAFEYHSVNGNINKNWTTEFRTQTKGNADYETYLSVVRSNNTDANRPPDIYGDSPTIVFGVGDVHGFINLPYYPRTNAIVVGGGGR